ncbi:MAG: sulfite exporter TauE/SafE family protein [Oscillospiraceae bacterium]|nr:sulfite exporter TauE/SafE family protein [Oscillospiraceae bacterium]
MSFIAASVVGFLSGVLASMGLGGGFVLVVYFAIFTDFVQKGAQGINLLFFIPITVIAAAIHIKNRLIDVKTALVCSAIGIPAVVAGFYLAQSMDNGWLRKGFAVFIIISGLKDLLAKDKGGKDRDKCIKDRDNGQG